MVEWVAVVGNCERGTLHVVLTHEGDELKSAEAKIQALAPQLASAGKLPSLKCRSLRRA